ncbi:uncharacterized protein K489DRAFT_349610 [Dissoconium aciculare CBS 342.82]|uniref:Uncharacterized protein n=1 Tax=Dissoconium aciculare CBS 342.82 TaxID=1314786 RepID=A0A6J3MJE9_9PEZI|nr:uncharacterized protein K489DRAFT_349610 [Dissoconium aciculare CBS 342.82]KAF1827869.1 hypothetical protein K489DRAFT_349610 [Dissoconium aciculare CBS 342.82]
MLSVLCTAGVMLSVWIYSISQHHPSIMNDLSTVCRVLCRLANSIWRRHSPLMRPRMSICHHRCCDYCQSLQSQTNNGELFSNVLLCERFLASALQNAFKVYTKSDQQGGILRAIRLFEGCTQTSLSQYR